MYVYLYSLPQGNVPTRESIHLYYQNHMMKLSEESGLDSIDKNPSQAPGLQASERMDSLDSAASHDSISRYWFNFILWKTEGSCTRCNIRYCLNTDELSNQCWILFLIFPCQLNSEKYYMLLFLYSDGLSCWLNFFSTAWLPHFF